MAAKMVPEKVYTGNPALGVSIVMILGALILFAHFREKRQKRALLSRLFAKDSDIKNLDFSGKFLGKDQIQFLAAALKMNKPIHSLNLARTQITDEGLLLLAEAIAENSTVTIINLRKNHIADVGAVTLAHALQKNKKVQRILIGGNSFSSEARYALLTLQEGRDLIVDFD